MRHLGSATPSIDLLCGGAFARGLEVFRKRYYGDKADKATALEEGMMAGVAMYGDFEVPEGKENKGPDRIITALAAYVERFNPDTDHLQPVFAPNGQPMVEFTFSIPLPILHPDTDEPLIYAGRFDMVGKFQDMLVGVDEKTTGQLGNTWKNQWDLRGQFTGYTWAMQQYGFPVMGCVARGVSFLSLNSKVAWNNSGHGFEESLQLRPQYMIDQWYAQLLADIENAKRAYVNNWYDQNFSDTCTAYSGCAFKRLCTSAEPEAFTSMYGERKWDPLAKVPEQPKQVVETVEAPDELRALMGLGERV